MSRSPYIHLVNKSLRLLVDLPLPLLARHAALLIIDSLELMIERITALLLGRLCPAPCTSTSMTSTTTTTCPPA